MKSLRTTKAFTLLEMLLVVAIIAILAGIVIVAINPGRQLAQARNAQRANDLRALHSAVNQYYIDNFGWPGTLGETFVLTEICDDQNEPNGCLDLETYLVPTYISAIPRDPQALSGTGYQIALNSNQTPALTAPRSVDDFRLAAVQIGTSTLVLGEGGGDDNGNGNGDDNGNGDNQGPDPVVVALRNGLVGYWPLDETSGTVANDHSGNENHGTANNARVFISAVEGIINNGADFTQGNDYIVANISTGNVMTVSGWFYMTSYANDLRRGILSKRENGNGWNINVGGTTGSGEQSQRRRKLTFLEGNDDVLVSNSEISLNTWYHFVIVANSTSSALYLNGELDATGSGAWTEPSGQALNIGRGRPLANRFFWDGVIDEVALWDRPLTSQEIQSLYNGGLGRSLKIDE